MKMKLERKEKLKKDIEIISNIALKAQEYFLIVEYLLKPEDDDATSYEKKMNSFFYYSKISYWQLIVIELAKLYNHREKFSLEKMIGKLNNDGEYSQLNISDKIISDWRNVIKSNKKAIENLKLQRDKIYAHEEGKSETIENEVSFQDIRNLLEFANDIIKIVRKSLDLMPLMFEIINSPAKNLEYCIKRLVNEKTKHNTQYNKLGRKH